MSIRFQIASALVRASGMKKLFALPQEELLEKVRKMNRKRSFQIPTRKQFRYTERTILGQHAEAPYFAKAFEKYGAPCEFHIGQGLCHCYLSFDFYPEGKQAQEEIIGLLQKGVSV